METKHISHTQLEAMPSRTTQQENLQEKTSKKTKRVGGREVRQWRTATRKVSKSH